MRFVVLVEGKTEKKALPGFLGRWFFESLGKHVKIKTELVVGLEDLKTKARKHLNSRKQEKTIAVIGLLDLYGLEEIPRGKKSRDEYYDFAVAQIIRDLKHPKFCMFFAVHELEAWLLSQPNSLPPEVRKALPPAAEREPESVDFNDPPSKLLGRLYWEKLRRGYKKVTDGGALFSQLHPSVARDKCPHLEAMLDEMLDLAKAATQ